MAFTGLTVQGDHLIVAHTRGFRVLYTADGERGAWTTVDTGVDASHFADDEDVTYFVGASGPVGGAEFGVFRYAPRSNSGRGEYSDGTAATVRATSRTLGVSDNHTKVPWHRAGARIHAVGSSPSGSVQLVTGSKTVPEESGPAVSKSLSGIDEVYAQSPGPATEAHVVVDAEGDVRIESAMVMWHGEAPVR